MSEEKFPFEDHILQMKPGQEDVVFIKGRAFVVSVATDDDIERIAKGFFVID